MKTSSFISLFVLILFASCAKNEVTNIALDKSNINISVGQIDSVFATVTITGEMSKLPLTWTSSNAGILTVTEVENSVASKTDKTYTKTALITGVSVGSAIVTVKAGEKTITCQVTVDDIYPNLTQAELWYWGDAYSSNVSNNFTLYLGSSDIKMDDLSGYGEVLILELNSPLTVKDSIPQGTYEMMTDLSLVENFKAKTLVPAYINENNQKWGSWYYGETVNPIIDGNIIVKRSNNIYTIDYELFDEYGAKVSGVYSGPVGNVDGTVLAAVKKNVRANSVNMKFKSINLKR